MIQVQVQRSSAEEHWKDVKQRFQTRRSKGFLTCHDKFFSVVFFERDSELTLFGFGTAQSQSAEPQLEVHRASCPQIADRPLSSTYFC